MEVFIMFKNQTLLFLCLLTSGHISLAKLKSNSEIGYRSKESQLIKAVQLGDILKIQELICHGADAKAKDKYGNSTLHCVINELEEFNISEKTAIIITKILISAGADIEATTKHGNNTPLQEAVKATVSVELVKTLIRAGADVNLLNYNNQNLIHILIDEIEDTIDDGSISFEQLEFLYDTIKQTFKIDLRSIYISILQELIAAGINVNEKNKYGETPLHTLMQTQDIKIIKKIINMLLSATADINAQDQSGETSLHTIIDQIDDCKERDRSYIKGVKEIIIQLLKHGINANIANESGETPAQLAEELSNKTLSQEIVNCLKAY
jgi:ankyrin repeat protein